MNDTMNSPFRYAGGKFYARKLILEHIPSHTIYVEPFAGGASIFFAKSKARMNILNDKDDALINVYRVIRDKPEDLASFLLKRPSRESRIPDGLTGGVKIGAPLPADKRLHRFFKNEYAPTNNIILPKSWTGG